MQFLLQLAILMGIFAISTAMCGAAVGFCIFIYHEVMDVLDG